eukprot:1444333-Rhodomonas_salina.1
MPRSLSEQMKQALSALSLLTAIYFLSALVADNQPIVSARELREPRLSKLHAQEPELKKLQERVSQLPVNELHVQELKELSKSELLRNASQELPGLIPEVMRGRDGEEAAHVSRAANSSEREVGDMRGKKGGEVIPAKLRQETARAGRGGRRSHNASGDADGQRQTKHHARDGGGFTGSGGTPAPSDGELIHWPYGLTQYGRGGTSSTTQAYVLMIAFCFRPQIKTFHKEHTMPKPFRNDTWYFMSQHKEPDRQKKKTHSPWKVIHSREGLERGQSQYLENAVRNEYAPIFAFNRSEQDAILDYMKLWKDLRRCCGLQLSQSFADKLRKGNRTGHACFDIDTKKANEQVVRTEVFRRCPRLRSTSEHDQGIGGEMDEH